MTLQPLHLAALGGHTETVRALVSAGANVNAQNEDGWSPVHFAAGRGEVETVLALVSTGADIQMQNQSGFGPWYYYSHSDEENWTLLDQGGWTPLHVAALKGHTEVASALIHAAGAIVDATDEDFRSTPLHLAAFRGHTETVQVLISAHASVNATNTFGSTALHTAVISGQTETVQALISAGANPRMRNHNGQTPLDLAHEDGHERTALVLRSQTKGVNAGCALYILVTCIVLGGITFINVAH